MRYWESAEVEKSVQSSLYATRSLIHDDIVRVINKGGLANSDWELCYIPIVMGPEFIDLFPPRTNLDRRKRKLYHSPQLRFEIFQNGTENQKAAEYLNGIILITRELFSIGLDDEQIAEFRSGIESLLPMDC